LHRVEIARRASQGDRSVLPQLRTMLDAMDERRQAREGAGSSSPSLVFRPMASATEEALLSAMFGDDLLAIEDTRRQLAALRRELAGEGSAAEPTPLERLLIERIASCWLSVHYHETIYAKKAGTLAPQLHRLYQDRIDRAHRRYLSSLKALAQIRRLQLPPAPVQVNIAAAGGQQVNVAEITAEVAMGSPQTASEGSNGSNRRGSTSSGGAAATRTSLPSLPSLASTLSSDEHD
jgi:hypothetical protein